MLVFDVIVLIFRRRNIPAVMNKKGKVSDAIIVIRLFRIISRIISGKVKAPLIKAANRENVPIP
jgi:hypothetical protein